MEEAHAGGAGEHSCTYHTDTAPSFSSRHLGLDLVPRKDFEVVDSDQISVSDLYKMVRNSVGGSSAFSLWEGKKGKCFYSLLFRVFLFKLVVSAKCLLHLLPYHQNGVSGSPSTLSSGVL